jgi:hypothetical protein
MTTTKATTQTAKPSSKDTPSQKRGPALPRILKAITVPDMKRGDWIALNVGKPFLVISDMVH